MVSHQGQGRGEPPRPSAQHTASSAALTVQPYFTSLVPSLLPDPWRACPLCPALTVGCCPVASPRRPLLTPSPLPSLFPCMQARVSIQGRSRPFSWSGVSTKQALVLKLPWEQDTA